MSKSSQTLLLVLAALVANPLSAFAAGTITCIGDGKPTTTFTQSDNDPTAWSATFNGDSYVLKSQPQEAGIVFEVTGGTKAGFNVPFTSTQGTMLISELTRNNQTPIAGKLSVVLDGKWSFHGSPMDDVTSYSYYADCTISGLSLPPAQY